MKKALNILLFLLNFYSKSEAQNNSIILLDYFEEACDVTKDQNLYKTRISEIKYEKDTAFISIAFLETCGENFKGKIELRSDTLNFYYSKTDAEIFCACCYTLTYKLLGFDEKKIKILFRNEKIPISEVEYFVENSKIDTLPNGDIIATKFLDGILEHEVIRKKDRIIYRKYRNGEIYYEKEKKLKTKN